MSNTCRYHFNGDGVEADQDDVVLGELRFCHAHLILVFLEPMIIIDNRYNEVSSHCLRSLAQGRWVFGEVIGHAASFKQ